MSLERFYHQERSRFYHQERSNNTMLWRHVIGLEEEEGIYKNWYPSNKNFIARDFHCPASYSICFEKTDEHILPKSDQNTLYTLTVPLGMQVKAVLKYHDGKPDQVELIQLTPEELAKQEEIYKNHKEQYHQHTKT